jgi:hypothetical protein
MLNKTEIMNGLTRTMNRAGLQLKKHSPEILVATGIVTGIAGAITACKATTKLSAIVDETKEHIEELHETVAKIEAGEVVKYRCEDGTVAEYKIEDSKKDLTIMYAQAGLKIAKLYGPSILLGTISITSILAGHNIMRKRNAGLAAAYMVLDKSFKDYRGRVVERFGKELDRELKYNIKTAEVEEVVVDEKGNETVVKKTVEVVDPNTYSEYAVIWCEGNVGWTKDANYNRMFLQRQQAYFSDKLRLNGHVFLNEVYDALGFPRTKAGNIVGWVYDEKNPIGDNFVDFGIFDIHDPAKVNFVNGHERNILLDFNVDGPILDLI